LDADILKESNIPIIYSCIDLDRFAKPPNPQKIRADPALERALR
jgi:hypothetical protein